MGKKKGRQCGGFPSKAMRAAYCTEWQSLASEVELRKIRRTHDNNKNINTTTKPQQSLSERPKFRLNHLQHVLQERLQEDRLQDRARRQSQNSMTRATTKQTASHKATTTQPEFNTYDGKCDDYRESGLAYLCIQALAPVLEAYIDSMGRDEVHYMLSLLPSKTLTALCVELSTRNLWNSKDVLYVVTHHAHLSRLCISLNANDNTSQQDLEEALVFQPSLTILNQQQQQQRVVPDSWEDEALLNEEEEEEHSKHAAAARRLLQRVELRNMPQLSAETVVSLLLSGTTTHVSLINSLNPTSGPHFVEYLATTSDHQFHVLHFLSCDWMTEELLLRLEENGVCSLLLQAQGCGGENDT